MKKIKLLTSDLVEVETDTETIKCSGTIQSLLEVFGPEREDIVIPLPNVSADVLQRILEWSNHHRAEAQRQAEEENAADDDDDDEPPLQNPYIHHQYDEPEVDVTCNYNNIGIWDQAFFDTDSDTFFDIISAANYLDIKDLYDTTTKILAKRINKGTVDSDYFVNILKPDRKMAPAPPSAKAARGARAARTAMDTEAGPSSRYQAMDTEAGPSSRYQAMDTEAGPSSRCQAMDASIATGSQAKKSGLVITQRNRLLHAHPSPHEEEPPASRSRVVDTDSSSSDLATEEDFSSDEDNPSSSDIELVAIPSSANIEMEAGPSSANVVMQSDSSSNTEPEDLVRLDEIPINPNQLLINLLPSSDSSSD